VAAYCHYGRSTVESIVDVILFSRYLMLCVLSSAASSELGPLSNPARTSSEPYPTSVAKNPNHSIEDDVLIRDILFPRYVLYVSTPNPPESPPSQNRR
jgi:hypothetical protein